MQWICGHVISVLLGATIVAACNATVAANIRVPTIRVGTGFFFTTFRRFSSPFDITVS